MFEGVAMTIKPFSWLEERIELMAFYHTRTLVVITFLVSLLSGSVIYVLLYTQILPDMLKYALSGTTFVSFVTFLFKVFQSFIGQK